MGVRAPLAESERDVGLPDGINSVEQWSDNVNLLVDVDRRRRKG